MIKKFKNDHFWQKCQKSGTTFWTFLLILNKKWQKMSKNGPTFWTLFSKSVIFDKKCQKMVPLFDRFCQKWQKWTKMFKKWDHFLIIFDQNDQIWRDQIPDLAIWPLQIYCVRMYTAIKLSCMTTQLVVKGLQVPCYIYRSK